MTLNVVVSGHVDHIFHGLIDGAELSAKLDQVLAKLDVLTQKEKQMALTLDALTAQVTANTSAEASAIALIQGLADQIAAASGNQAAVDALAVQLKASADALGAAVVANTPAA